MGDQTSYARGSCPKPSHHDNGKCLPQEPLRIRFRHPGYQDTDNVLLTLPGLDFVDGGIHYETARVACAIIANNQFHGYFTEDKEGAQRVLVWHSLSGRLLLPCWRAGRWYVVDTQAGISSS
jgi:hypothetical protein